MFRSKLLAAIPICLALPAAAAAADFRDGSPGRHRHYEAAGYGEIGGPALVREPAFFPGAGSGAPFGGRVAIVEYREPYIPRGVLYNFPGPPAFGRSAVIRAKY